MKQTLLIKREKNLVPSIIQSLTEDYNNICFEMLLIVKKKENSGQSNKKRDIKALNILARLME